MSVGKRIQQARKAANLSQRGLGDKLSVSASMIGQYENDVRNPKAATLQRIADALNVDSTWLRTGETADDTGKTNAVCEAHREVLEYVNLFCTSGEKATIFINYCGMFKSVLKQLRSEQEGKKDFLLSTLVGYLLQLEELMRKLYPEGVYEIMDEFRKWQQQRQSDKILFSEYTMLNRKDQKKVAEYVALLNIAKKYNDETDKETPAKKP